MDAYGCFAHGSRRHTDADGCTNTVWLICLIAYVYIHTYLCICVFIYVYIYIMIHLHLCAVGWGTTKRSFKLLEKRDRFVEAHSHAINVSGVEI